MTRRTRCAHSRPLGAVSPDGCVDVLAQMLRVAGSCPDCANTDGEAKLAILRALPSRHDLAWVASEANVGALVHVEINPETWRGKFGGNIGMPGHFVGRFCGVTKERLRFWTGPGRTVTLQPCSIKSAEIIIPASFMRAGLWQVSGLTFSLTPGSVAEARPQRGLVAV